MTKRRGEEPKLLKTGSKVEVEGIKTEIITYIEEREAYLVAGIGEPIKRSQIKLLEREKKDFKKGEY